MPEYVSEEDFVKVWKKHLSPSKVSVELGLSVRQVMYRRRHIELKRGITLFAVDPKQRGTSVPSIKLTIDSKREVNKLKITDGVVLVASDAHYAPDIVSAAHEGLCVLAKSLGSELIAVVMNGDILDGATISRHPPGGWEKMPTVNEELEAVQARLEDIERAVAPGVKLMRTYGNHCSRFESRLAANASEFRGVRGFTLREHLPRWTDSQRIDINDDTVILHDWHSGLHSGWNDVLKGGCNVVTGHTHELGFKAHTGFKNTHFGIKTGMLAEHDQDQFQYRKGKPGFNWRSGFAVLTWVNKRLIQPEFCTVEFDGRAYFRGYPITP